MRKLTYSEVVDVFIEVGLSPSIYVSLWDDIASWSLKALVEVGLQKTSTVLDFGSGALRCGLPVIDYIDDNLYTGFEPFDKYRAASKMLLNISRVDKRITLLSEIDDVKDGTKFNFIILNSVFTHMSNSEIANFLSRAKNFMNEKSIIFATITYQEGYNAGRVYASSFPHSLPSFKNFETFSAFCVESGFLTQKTGLTHPTGQDVVLLSFKG